jgi:hypothetical protein
LPPSSAGRMFAADLPYDRILAKAPVVKSGWDLSRSPLPRCLVNTAGNSCTGAPPGGGGPAEQLESVISNVYYDLLWSVPKDR